MNFLLTGKIKPYVRMTQRGKWVDPQAQEYLASKAAIQWQLKQQMNGSQIMPAKAPLILHVHFQLPRVHGCDLDNLVKAVCDALQGVAIYDDRWIDEVHASKSRGEHLCHAIVTLK